MEKTFDNVNRDAVLLAFLAVPAIPIEPDDGWNRCVAICIFVQPNVKPGDQLLTVGFGSNQPPSGGRQRSAYNPSLVKVVPGLESIERQIARSPAAGTSPARRSTATFPALFAAAIAGPDSPYSPGLMQEGAAEAPFPHRHLLGIERLSPDDINQFLDLADGYVELNRQAEKKRGLLRGRTIINCFFENSTRTRTSFEVAGKRLGGDVINMSVSASSMVKGETLIDTAMTLNAMHPDAAVVHRLEASGVQLTAR